MAGLAMMMFIALFAFGGQYFGWSDSGGRIQLALFSAYIFGIICGYRVEEIEDPFMREVRYLDKLIDELAKGKSMEKILRTP